MNCSVVQNTIEFSKISLANSRPLPALFTVAKQRDEAGESSVGFKMTSVSHVMSH